MCGFAGIINFDGLPKSPSLHRDMRAASDSLYPRGPNQKGQWTDDFSYIVHSRLSILDLSEAGIQPMLKYGKVIVYNGEIYNFLEIKIELEKEGYNFESHSDCEVLLSAWDKWGLDCLDKIRGMFSFVIWDKNNKKVYLVRDPFGKKPLLYSQKNNSIAFASDLKALEKIINTGGIDTLAVQSLFKLRFIAEPLTIYKNAKKIPSGNLAIFDEDNFNIKRWYNLPKNEDLYLNKNFIKTELIKIFDSAVNKRLISDVPVGVFLSGGIDSSLIVASLAEMNANVPCFTMGFKGSSTYYEERPNAKKLADHFGMKHYDFEISDIEVLKKLPLFFEACDEPFADSSAVPYYFLSQNVKEKVTVALSGDGGDEIFGGYRKYLAERWSHLSNIIPDKLKNVIANQLYEDKDTFSGELYRKIRRFLMTSSSIPSKRQALWLEQIKDEDMINLFGGSGLNTESILLDHRSGFNDSINSMLAGDIGVSLCGDMLVKADRMSMANSLEVRSPFLDRDLVEFAFRIPGKYKVGAFSGKKILKEIFSKRLPEWSLGLPKKGFEMPVASWLREDLKPLINKISEKKNLEQLGIIDTGIIDNWKLNLFNRRRDTSWQLWTLLVYDQWSRSKGLT